MKKYGYARVSTDDQSLDIQRDKLTAFGCDVILEEKVSGGSMKGRDQLDFLLKVISEGDVLVVTKTDRLGRDLLDQCTVCKHVEKRGAGIMAIDEMIDTRSEGGRLYFHIMSVIAEQERRRIRARQAEGIAKAKAAGRYRRKVKVTREMIASLKAKGLTPTEMKRELNCGRTTLYRVGGDILVDGKDVLIKAGDTLKIAIGVPALETA